MTTVLIRTDTPEGCVTPDRSRTVHGLVYLEHDPVAMDVVARRPKPRKPSELVEERLPRMAVLRNLKKRHDLAPREAARALIPGEHLQLEVDPPDGRP